jgi:hypothetical protein
MEFIEYMESKYHLHKYVSKLTHWQGNQNPEAAVCLHCACNERIFVRCHTMYCHYNISFTVQPKLTKMYLNIVEILPFQQTKEYYALSKSLL